jgi:hypothetical protein
MKRKQHSTTTANLQTRKIFGRSEAHQSLYRSDFRAIETLWRILFQSEPDQVQR